MTATPTSRPSNAGGVQVLRVHVDRHRVAFAEGGGVGDLEIVDVDVVIAKAAVHRGDEAHGGVAAADTR